MKFELKLRNLNVPDEDLLNDLKKVALELGNENLTSREYDNSKKRKYSAGTIGERFGGWNKALELAGLTVKYHQNISTDALLENIEQVWLKLGRQPGKRDMKLPLSKYSESPYRANFKTWQKALEQFVESINLEEEIEQSDETKSEAVETENTVNSKSEIVFRHKTKRDINWRLRFLVMRRDNFKCNACGKSPTNNPGTELHIDHILAWDKGGETVYENLQTLCSVCNIGKSNLDFKE